MKTRVFILLISLMLPTIIAARFQRTPQIPVRPAPGSLRPVPGPVSANITPEQTPIRTYGKPPAPQIPAQTLRRPPAQMPPHQIKPKPPKPPWPPHHREYKYSCFPPILTVYSSGTPLQYTYAWYKDRYVILYEGWFWYNKQWVWGGLGAAPAKPAWRPE